MSLITQLLQLALLGSISGRDRSENSVKSKLFSYQQDWILEGTDQSAEIFLRYCLNCFCFPDGSEFEPVGFLAYPLNAKGKASSADTETLPCGAHLLLTVRQNIVEGRS